MRVFDGGSVFRSVFDRVDERRDLPARDLGVDTDVVSDDEVVEAAVEPVVAVGGRLDLPTRLRELHPVVRADAPAIAEFTTDDAALARSLEGFHPTADELEDVIDEPW